MTVRLGACAVFVLVYIGRPVHVEAREGRRLAVVVGVNEFQDSKWPSLHFAEKDARDMATVLSESFDEVLHLHDEPPTRTAILGLLDHLEQSNTSDLDTVLVYISTHGTLARDAHGELLRTLVLQDTNSEHPSTTGLSYHDLLVRLDALRSKHKLVILAACYAGAGKSVLSDQLRHELRGLKGAFFSEPALPAGEGRLVLAASAWGEPAREDDSLENDVYTHYFVQALRGFDRNGDGAITALEAHDFARTRTMEFTHNRQRPTLSAEIVGEDPIVLVGRRVRVGHPIIAAYGRAFDDARLEVDGRYKGDLPGGYVISPGARHVRVTRPDTDVPVLDEHVDVAGSKPVLLDELLKHESLELVPSIRAGWQFTYGEVAKHFLPGFPRIDLSLELTRPGNRWRAGLSVGGSMVNQSIAVRSGRTSLQTGQGLRLLHVSANVTAEAWRWSWLVLAATARAGWSFGQRSLDLKTVLPPNQGVSFPRAGAGVEIELWPLEPIGLRISSDFELLILRTDGALRAVPSQICALSVLWAP